MITINLLNIMKKCTGPCGKEKELSAFYLNNKKNRRENKCKECISKYNKECYLKNRNKRLCYQKQYNQYNKEDIVKYNKQYREDNRDYLKEKNIQYREINQEILVEKNKEYYQNNREELLDYQIQYIKEHEEEIKEYKTQYYQNNKEELLNKQKQYYQDNKEERNNYNNKYNKKKREGDINFKISCSLRKRISGIIKNNQKAGSAIKDLGCSIDFLKQYFESKFYTNIYTEICMTWDNYGTEWHIDHIIPLVTFDLTDENQFCRACHYINLQPLWAEDNLEKSDSLTWNWE